MRIKRGFGFVIQEGENMVKTEEYKIEYNKNYTTNLNDVQDMLDILSNFEKYLERLLNNSQDYKTEQDLNNSIKDFFDWLLEGLKHDAEAVKSNGYEYEYLYNDYCKAEELLLQKQSIINKNLYLYLFNDDSKQMLIKILTTYKEEYNVFEYYKKDIVFYNDLLGWYKNIPDDLIMFIESLFKRQYNINTDTYRVTNDPAEYITHTKTQYIFAA